MKLGCCTNLLAKGDDKIGIDNVELIAKAGFDYVELPIACIMELSDEEFGRMKERLDRAGIPAYACCNLFPASVRVTGNDVDENKIREYLKKAFARAKELGTEIIVFGSSGARNVEEGFPFETAMLQILKTIHIIDECAYEGLTVVIEHICCLEGNIIRTVKDGCMVHDVCCADSVEVLADTYHMYVENEPLENIRLAGSHLAHVHTACPVGRVYPSEGDGIDYKAMFDMLRSVGYDGGISIEGYSSDVEKDLNTAHKMFRELAAQ